MSVRVLRSPLPRSGPRIGPWPGLAMAAGDVVHHLQQALPLDLWVVTHVEDDTQLVVAAAGPWQEHLGTGTALSWQASMCRRMVASGGPALVSDVAASAEYGPVAVGPLARIRAYLGVPLQSTDGELYGTLCALSGQTQGRALQAAQRPAMVFARMLSTIAAGERTAAERSAEAASAYALAERDRLTGLLNRRGWDAVVHAEQQRAMRYGSPVSVVAVDLDGLKELNDTQGHPAGDAALAACATTLRRTCRPGDSPARVGGDEFGLLAVECDAASAVALQGRLRTALRAAGVSGSVGVATRRTGESLSDTWSRADQAMYRSKRRRRQRRP